MRPLLHKQKWPASSKRWVALCLLLALPASPAWADHSSSSDESYAKLRARAMASHTDSCSGAWKAIALGAVTAPLAAYGISQFVLSPHRENELADNGLQLLDVPIPTKVDPKALQNDFRLLAAYTQSRLGAINALAKIRSEVDGKLEDSLKDSAVSEYFKSRASKAVEVEVPSRFDSAAKKSGINLGPARKIEVSRIEPLIAAPDVSNSPADALPSSVETRVTFVPGQRSKVDDLIAQYLAWKWKGTRQTTGSNPQGTFRDFLFQTFPSSATATNTGWPARSPLSLRRPKA